MTLNQGDQVLVNLAPFIASRRRHWDAVPCRVLQADGTRLLVRTCRPVREIELWIDACWIDEVLVQREWFDMAEMP